MGREIKDVLQFCTDVVHRRPHQLDRLMELLNLDSHELLTNANLQQVTALLKDHYDLLSRFGRIFLPSNYKLCPWKDMVTGKVYCMLMKGEAMYKLTSLDNEMQQFNAIEAARRHEAEERIASSSGGGDNNSPPVVSSSHVARVPLEDDSSVETTTTEAKKSRKRPRSSNEQQALSERRGSRSRPKGRQFSLAVPFLNDLSSEELMEFLHHKDVVGADGDGGFKQNKQTMVEIIVKDCKLSDSSPFEVLPTFLKNFKTSGRVVM